MVIYDSPLSSNISHGAKGLSNNAVHNIMGVGYNVYTKSRRQQIIVATSYNKISSASKWCPDVWIDSNPIKNDAHLTRHRDDNSIPKLQVLNPISMTLYKYRGIWQERLAAD